MSDMKLSKTLRNAAKGVLMFREDRAFDALLKKAKATADAYQKVSDFLGSEKTQECVVAITKITLAHVGNVCGALGNALRAGVAAVENDPELKERSLQVLKNLKSDVARRINETAECVERACQNKELQKVTKNLEKGLSSGLCDEHGKSVEVHVQTLLEEYARVFKASAPKRTKRKPSLTIIH